jgi:dihydrofolate reductase
MNITIIDFISIDGVTQAPGGPEEDTDGGFEHGGWSHPYFDVDVMGPAISQVMEESEALLYGRRTWQGMAAAWPGRAGDPFADSMNAIKKYVVSSSLSADEASSGWSNTELIPGDGDPFAAIQELRESGGDGRVQVWGSSSLARQLIERDLVDEYQLILEPVMLGGGKSIFPTDGNKRPLELVDVKQTSVGTILLTYRPAKS